MKTLILVIDDETEIAHTLKLELEFEGYQVIVENDGIAGLETAVQEKPELILLDVMLPGLSGMEVLRRLRKDNRKTPVILLTARNATFDIVVGLDQGANDYVTKPFEMDELLARIRACLRNQFISKKDQPVLQVDDLVIDTDTRKVSRHGKNIILTPKEYDFLVYLVTNKNKVATRESILDNVWGFDYDNESNIIDVTVTHLRKKIDDDRSSQLISTVWGVGYVIREENK